jgi:hypothetical protein
MPARRSAGRRGVQFPPLPFGKKRAVPLRAHVSIGERLAGACNRALKAAHEANLDAVIHPGPIGVVDEHAKALPLGKVLEHAAPEGERHCDAILFVLGVCAIAGIHGQRSCARGGLRSRGAGASGGLRVMLKRLPGIDAQGAKQEPEERSAEIAGPLRHYILERRQIRAAMGQSTAAIRTGSAQNGQSLIPLAGITIPRIWPRPNTLRPASETGGQTIQPSSLASSFATAPSISQLFCCCRQSSTPSLDLQEANIIVPGLR